MILERNPDAITQTLLTDTHETMFECAARCSDVAVSRFGECVFNLEDIHDTYANIRFLVMTETSPPYQSWVTTVLVDSYCAEEFFHSALYTPCGYGFLDGVCSLQDRIELLPQLSSGVPLRMYRIGVCT